MAWHRPHTLRRNPQHEQRLQDGLRLGGLEDPSDIRGGNVVSAFRPFTAREALLAIAAESNAIGVSDPVFRANARELARLGLDHTAIENYELTDQLADQLAEAHKLLREIRKGTTIQDGDPPEFIEHVHEIDQALALPPDLEAMVERRIG